MTFMQLPKPKAWARTLVLAGMGLFAIATVAHAQNPHIIGAMRTL